MENLPAKPDCYKCEGQSGIEPKLFHGYMICDSCKDSLRLQADQTIAKNKTAFEASEKKNPDMISFLEEVQNRLSTIEKEYIGARIRLLHIADRLKAKK